MSFGDKKETAAKASQEEEKVGIGLSKSSNNLLADVKVQMFSGPMADDKTSSMGLMGKADEIKKKDAK